MSCNAQVSIWVGLSSKDEMEDETSDVVEELLKDVAVEEIYGFPFDRIRSGEDTCGWGFEVYEHDWDYGPRPFDVSELDRLIAKARVKLQDLFDKRGVKAEIGVWCQTDFR